MTLKKGVDIISIGDEILIGQVENTNASWMADQLNRLGFFVNRMLSISDCASAIQDALKTSMQSAKLVLVTGGLGPTKDDITKSCICDFFESKLVLDHEVLDHVTSFFEKRGFALTELNRLQAMVPNNCEVIKNPQGTAPGMYFVKEDTHFVFMPGVPFEMKGIMEDWVLPCFSKFCDPKAKFQRTILTSGMGESFLADRIVAWENNLPENVGLAYLPSPGCVRLRLDIEGESREEARSQLDKHIDDLEQIIPELIFGYDEETMEAVVGALLKQSGKTIAMAESCTGGRIGHQITRVSGSSSYFKGGVVAYANEIKSNLLDIDPRIIEEKGAVSEEVACLMAENVRKRMNADIAVSTTGIAGPDGGTEDKPVGTVWIGVATEEVVYAKKYQFGERRERNVSWSVMTALNMVRKELIKK